MSGIVTPSYRAGFYSPQRGGRAKYPQLWRGCVGAWCPSLGQTGSVLFGNSVRKNNGVISSTPITDVWGINEKGCLVFNSTTFVTLPNSTFPTGTSARTFSFWARPGASAGTQNAIFYGVDTTGNRFSITCTRTQIAVAVSGGNFGVTLTSSTSWRHFLVCVDAGKTLADVMFFVDGIKYAGSTIAGSSATSINTTNTSHLIGKGHSGVVWTDAMMDDLLVYNQSFPQHAKILSLRRGIAFETMRRRVYSIPASTGNRRRRMLICGAAR